MKIVVLGTSSELSFPRFENGGLRKDPISYSRDERDKRLRASIAIEFPAAKDEYVVIDPTSDFWEQIEKYDIADKVRSLLITNPRKDRTEGLFQKFTPYLTFALKAHWEGLEKALVPDSAKKVISKGLINLHGLRVFPFPVFSGDPHMMACGYKILGKSGESLVYLPNIRNIPKVSKKFLYNVDALVLDGRQWDYATDWHASMKEQLKWVQEFKPKKLYFTYIGHEAAPHKELVKMVREKYANSDVLYDGQILVIKENSMNPVDLIKDQINLVEVEDQTLLFYHSLLHSWFERNSRGEKMAGWPKEEIISFHKKVVEEMEKREFMHYTEDNLDRETFSDLRASINLASETALLETLNGSSVVEVDDYISVSQKSLHGETIDIYIKASDRKPLIEHQVSLSFPEEARKKLHFIYSTMGAPDTYIPLFDLSLNPRKALTPVVIDEDISPFKFDTDFNPLMPSAVFKEGEDLFTWAKDYYATGLLVAPIQDGVRMLVHVKDKEAKCRTRNSKKDVSASMPTVKSALESLDVGSLILDGILVDLSYPESAFATDGSKKISKLRFYAYDCLWYNGRDLHNEPYKKRLEFLNTAVTLSGEEIEVVPNAVCSTQEQLADAVNKSFGGEKVLGAFVREITSDYPLNGSTSRMVAFSMSDLKSLDVATAGDVLVDNKIDPEIQDETVNKPVEQ